MTNPPIIDYPTLHRWLNRDDKSQIEVGIMANLDNLIRTAIMFDDSWRAIQHLEARIDNLMKSIDLLNCDVQFYKSRGCKRFDCGERK